jgi:hypothetical protein
MQILRIRWCNSSISAKSPLYLGEPTKVTVCKEETISSFYQCSVQVCEEANRLDNVIVTAFSISEVKESGIAGHQPQTTFAFVAWSTASC